MSFSHSESTVIKRPVTLPYHIETYRLDWQRVLLAAAAALAALLVATILLLLAHWLAAWSWLAAAAAAAGALLAIAIAGTAVWLQLAEWNDHRAMIWELHTTYIDGLQATGATETTEISSTTLLQAEELAHVLLAALMVQRLIQQGAETPWATRNLRGPVFIGEQRSATISKPGAEALSRRFAELGLIAERSEGYAGRWVPRSADEVIELIWK